MLGQLDVGVLTFLGTATKQDDEYVAVLPKINAVTRPKVDAVFRNALTDRFYIGQIALFHSIQRRRNLGRGYGVESRKPPGKGRCTAGIKILDDFPCRHVLYSNL